MAYRLTYEYQFADFVEREAESRLNSLGTHGWHVIKAMRERRGGEDRWRFLLSRVTGAEEWGRLKPEEDSP